MRLQKNTSLALYSVIEFAIDPARHISAAEIADKYNVSPHHLAKVLSELARAGVVESVRGVGGGYRFATNARRVTLMDIIQLFEDLSPGVAEQREEQSPVDQALGAVLSEIDEIAKATFSSITLATMLGLIERQQRGAAATAARGNGEMLAGETPRAPARAVSVRKRRPRGRRKSGATAAASHR
jgi:Rrf2 family protein